MADSQLGGIKIHVGPDVLRFFRHLGIISIRGTSQFAWFDQFTASVDGYRYFELNLEHFEFLYDVKRSTIMVLHFFVTNLKVECLAIQLS